MNRTDDAVARIRRACPFTIDDMRLFVDDADQRRLLRQIVGQPGLPGPVPLGPGPRRVSRPVVVGVAAASAAAALGLVVLLAIPRAGVPPTHVRAAQLRLAGHRFTLPTGYRLTAADTCAAADASGGGQPHTVIEGMVAAASSEGGCISAEAVAGTVPVPTGSRPVRVGSARGYESASTGSTTLYVAVAGDGSDQYLVLVGTGVSPAELVGIAATAFPG